MTRAVERSQSRVKNRTDPDCGQFTSTNRIRLGRVGNVHSVSYQRPTTAVTVHDGDHPKQLRDKPIFDNLEDLPHAQLPKISGKSPLAKAFRYALNRRPKTRPYLDNVFLELDNNSAERVMKPVAIGHKNIMFAGSENGGKDMAIPFTLIEAAKQNKGDP